MPLRKVIFWVHLAAGLVAGVVIAIMSATGIAIAFEEEILRWYDREVSRVQTVGQPGSALSIVELKSRVEAERPGEAVSTIAMFRDPARAWEVYIGEEGHLYVNPFTGVSQASRAHDAHAVIHLLEEWHRWLGAREGITSGSKLVTGVCNLALVFLCVTGLWLWFPRRWSWRALRPLLFLKTSYKGKARDFNWHNVFGFWSLPVLLILSVTAVAISFEWGHRLPFILAGEEAPKSRNYGMMFVPAPVVPTPSADAPRLPLEAAFAKVAEAFPDWDSITLEVMPDPAVSPADPLEFGVTVPDPMPSRGYIPVKSDPFTGAILQQVHFSDRSIGLQARIWARFLHTGGAFGLPGKI
ncbi:MAG: PepSY domain-containing protein, partial [Verrucomicrobiaceae bacterium]